MTRGRGDRREEGNTGNHLWLIIGSTRHVLRSRSVPIAAILCGLHKRRPASHQLAGEDVIGAFDLGLARVVRDSEHLVVPHLRGPVRDAGCRRIRSCRWADGEKYFQFSSPLPRESVLARLFEA